jgi:hypothetical protein
VLIVATTTRQTGTADVMELLRAGVPLTLLLDLADPYGPRSYELYDVEGDAARGCPTLTS